ncbi:Surface polysaccharide O-acyltransferase, integral membrane enzyme [Trichococcus flocculiformis]|uniref:acyltransferase n=1 Tax=Trichococcus TaxID=82802 RepID=UPI0007A83EC0|nr:MULTISPECIES: acyltransferase family protein [Trichococcus]CZR10827.1 acyltransferase 3 [Trichococcus sp. ES5]SHG27386.1 Surface polysaccharide O-acyltransferase, integral membrane enzyme [Trichococcus flocculiformis]
MQTKKLGPNLVKCISIFSVIGVHFILNTMDHVQINGHIPEFIYFSYRQLFIICVPLFMLTTGYLNYKQEVSKKYYRKLISIIGTYVFFSFLSILFRIFILHEELSILKSLFLILNFKASPYNWYLNMYVGLFLLSPFLNKMVYELPQKHLKWLLLCLDTLTILPITLNFFTHSIFQESGILLSNFWISLYPVTYYFTGVYLRLYPIRKIPRGLLTCIALLSIFISMYFSVDGNLSQVTKDYANILTYAQSILFFSVVLNFGDTKGGSHPFINFVASHTLEIYLVSYISDQIVYRLGTELFSRTYTDFFFAPIFVFSSFILATLFVSSIKKASSLVKG